MSNSQNQSRSCANRKRAPTSKELIFLKELQSSYPIHQVLFKLNLPNITYTGSLSIFSGGSKTARSSAAATPFKLIRISLLRSRSIGKRDRERSATYELYKRYVWQRASLSNDPAEDRNSSTNTAPYIRGHVFIRASCNAVIVARKPRNPSLIQRAGMCVRTLPTLRAHARTCDAAAQSSSACTGSTSVSFSRAASYPHKQRRDASMPRYKCAVLRDARYQSRDKERLSLSAKAAASSHRRGVLSRESNTERARAPIPSGCARISSRSFRINATETRANCTRIDQSFGPNDSKCSTRISSRTTESMRAVLLRLL
ncbi:unnamed protein product [Trichogramma brassicae]|uniref:Uncharacterized protein n=1 Tax=Trichogramma brassicae TaxID=86971 RepID=A0A6H5I8D5_9HYME|nr:unnamed protein product [Trichogramma brassicae]